jgi:cation diffusion facilitator CzcD-associated flavoprotein CzcO
MVDVAIIGSGPYGLSIAAHLKERSVSFRIFGNPMGNWLNHMPKGMKLKSGGRASSLYDPGSSLTLGRYCSQKGIPYADDHLPVSLETFCSYGLEFQRTFVPEVEQTLVSRIERSSDGLQVSLHSGEAFRARRVVIAVGLTYYDYIPPDLSGLSEDFVTHSSRYGDLEKFNGREVIVIGGGASAADVAAALHQAGAKAHLVARGSEIRFQDPPSNDVPSLWQRIRDPSTNIGGGWRVAFCAYAPFAFRYLPVDIRLRAVRSIQGPAPGWFSKDEVVGKVGISVGMVPTRVEVKNDRLNVTFRNGNGGQKTLEADHLIAATGYRVDLRRLPFLSPELLAEIRAVEQTPVLSSKFESSVPGLHFVGISAANSFGPLVRFACGAQFTARRLSGYLAKPVR